MSSVKACVLSVALLAGGVAMSLQASGDDPQPANPDRQPSSVDAPPPDVHSQPSDVAPRSPVDAPQASPTATQSLPDNASETSAAASAEPLRLIDRVNAAFGLRAAEVASLRVDTAPGAVQRIAVPLGGVVLTLDLAPYSVRSANYQVKYQQPDGSYVVVEPRPVRTVRGSLVGTPDVIVAGSVSDEGLTALIVFPDGGRYWIEPIAARVPGAAAGDHVIYSQQDVIPGGGSCAVENGIVARQNGGAATPEGIGCDTPICVTELACDSDVEYYNAWGEGVEDRINAVTNTMNVEYENDVGITHAITTIIVRPTEPDPYSSSNNSVLLGQFRTHWLQNQQDVVRDVAQLFTGRDIDGSVIGTAFTIGGICTNQAFCFVQSDCCGSFACATDLSAHEMGHLWNGFHCDCAGWTMNTPLTCANQFHPDFTIPGIIAHRNTRGCLSDTPAATAFPFEDAFAIPPLDPTRWLAEGASVDGQGDGEPSPPFSMHLAGDNRPTTGTMPAAAVEHVGVEYWWQRTGMTGGSPEPGEDLILEFLDDGILWREADRQLGDPGNGGDQLPYEHACVTLPDSAAYDGLQIRFRIDGGEPTDHFFVDDVRVFDATDSLSIVTQPELDCACLNGGGTFHVEAAGDPPFTYQWRLDGTPIPGATEDTLVVTPDGPEDFGFYSVDVSNLCGTIQSESAQLLEATPAQIIVPPQDVTLAVGDTLALTVVVSGTCNTFQWFFNDTPIPNANGAFLFIPNMQCENQGCYHAEVANDCGVVVSDIATVTVETCGPNNCDVDLTPPVIIHGQGLPGETRPHTGYIDPRSESTNGVDFDAGITEVQILFSEPVENVGGGDLTADAFLITETGSATPPAVVSVAADPPPAGPLVTLTLSRPLTPQEWTTVQAVVQDLADTPNVIVDSGNQGPGVGEPDRVDIGFLPADVDQNGTVNPLDLLRFKQFVNGIQSPAKGTLEDFLDIDRNGVINPLDLLGFKRLINGITPATQAWAGTSINHAQP